ncbi:hypothetical protein BDV93DRAFT_445627 [Ceratobasidium sp. AG-I]|nr:hypothetical protein BDV93DRAFT_445627 [Ceratobasidium sp. AG-I]
MPRRHISKEEKRLIVRMHARGASVQHLHDLTGVSIRAIQRAVQTQRETGDVVRTAPIIGRPRSLSGTDMAFLEACIERQPDLYLEELRELLDTTLGVQVSLDTIRRSLLRRGWTRKKVTTLFRP